MKYFGAAFYLSLFLVSSGALAEESHCLVQSFSEFGDTETCIENIRLSEEDFKQVCYPSNDEYVKFTTKYISSCPANYKGVCKGLKTQSGKSLPYLSYIYKNDISFMKSSCEKGGGVWEDGDA